MYVETTPIMAMQHQRNRVGWSYGVTGERDVMKGKRDIASLDYVYLRVSEHWSAVS